MLVCVGSVSQPLLTPFERGNGNQTATYRDGLDYYRLLDKNHKKAVLITAGLTDSGHPLHLFVVSKEGLRSPAKIGGRHVVLILNAIHPGESDGVDASMMLARDLLTLPEHQHLLDSVVVAIIPYYNIGGALNRGCCTRANQNGPETYGFRGNARNYDLNRDFIKADTRNTVAFQSIFHAWKPSLFLDTHVSNGADYQYTLTYIATNRAKLGDTLGQMFYEVFIPSLKTRMADASWEMTPYVDFDDVPERGMQAFFDHPRYSTGYAALFHCPSFMIETHMLKPYKDRVKATQAFLLESIKLCHEQLPILREAIRKQKQQTVEARNFVTDWHLDTTTTSQVLFKGYTARYEPSRVTGGMRLLYDQSMPYTHVLPYRDRFVPKAKVNVPLAYLIPAGWHTVIRELNRQGIRMYTISDTATVRAETYYIESYQTVKKPYEGHYLHYQSVVRSDTLSYVVQPGDAWIFTAQPERRYLCETLEPTCKDSFFHWNFFDSVLQPKEGFSDYVFEDTAEKMLQSDTALATSLRQRLQQDTTFARTPAAILQYLYEKSPYAEPGYMRYPVRRLHSIPVLSFQPLNIR